MDSNPFELGPIRPVDERESLLIRTTRGCPWNRCAFCVNYRQFEFSIRPVEEIKKDILAAEKFHRGRRFKTCFLQDGDSFVMKTPDLLEVLHSLKKSFPDLERISSYGRAQTMIRKTPEEMLRISDAGLNKLYCGMESGSDDVLKLVNKGTTAAEMVRAAKMAKESGMEVSEFIILGLGGNELWKLHATETARVLNEIDPDHIRVLTIGVKVGSGLEKLLQEGKYSLQTETNIIEEQRLLIENLQGIESSFVNHHSVDLLMEARGRLPQDKPRLLAIMDRFIALPEREKQLFILGRRLSLFQRLDDLGDPDARAQAESRLEEILARYPGRLEEVFHLMREQVV